MLVLPLTADTATPKQPQHSVDAPSAAAAGRDGVVVAAATGSGFVVVGAGIRRTLTAGTNTERKYIFEKTNAEIYEFLVKYYNIDLFNTNNCNNYNSKIKSEQLNLVIKTKIQLPNQPHVII